jgi:hypothetical protein
MLPPCPRNVSSAITLVRFDGWPSPHLRPSPPIAPEPSRCSRLRFGQARLLSEVFQVGQLRTFRGEPTECARRLAVVLSHERGTKRARRVTLAEAVPFPTYSSVLSDSPDLASFLPARQIQPVRFASGLDVEAVLPHANAQPVEPVENERDHVGSS